MQVRLVLLPIIAASIAACATPADRRAAARGDAPPRAFVSDGCTLAPDGDFGACCLEHDRAYWQGGSRAERRNVDQVLRACIARAGHPVLAAIYHRATRIGGGPWLPTPFRWAYGWRPALGYVERRDGSVDDAPPLPAPPHDQ